MHTSGRLLCASALSLLLVLVGAPAWGQWYDKAEAPRGEAQLVNPFTLKGFAMGSGGHVTSWIAPGNDILGLTFLVGGGYKFSKIPLYIGLEVPMSFGKPDEGDSEFALGGIGISVKTRVDPNNKRLGIFTGWSLDVFIPTFMGDTDMVNDNVGLAHATGLMNTLMPGIHVNPEAINVVGTFDFVVPRQYFFFQLELSAASYFPITDIEPRKIQGAIMYGATAGVNLAPEASIVLELKGYTPIGLDDEDGVAAPSMLALSPGLRLKIGPFMPAVFVSFPLSNTYRRAWSDIIIGLDLALWI